MIQKEAASIREMVRFISQAQLRGFEIKVLFEVDGQTVSYCLDPKIRDEYLLLDEIAHRMAAMALALDTWCPPVIDLETKPDQLENDIEASHEG